MDDEAYNHFQILWEELHTFGFDLSWLDLHVGLVLEAKSCKDNVDEVRKNVSALKVETEKLKATLIERETELKMASKDFKTAQERFKLMEFLVEATDIF